MAGGDLQIRSIYGRAGSNFRLIDLQPAGLAHTPLEERKQQSKAFILSPEASPLPPSPDPTPLSSSRPVMRRVRSWSHPWMEAVEKIDHRAGELGSCPGPGSNGGPGSKIPRGVKPTLPCRTSPATAPPRSSSSPPASVVSSPPRRRAGRRRPRPGSPWPSPAPGAWGLRRASVP